MDLLPKFILEHWILVSALSFSIILLIRNESRRSAPALSPQQAITAINEENGLFLDLRDPGEFKGGHIFGATNIPFIKLAGQLSQIEKYKDQPVVLVCKMGHQSAAGFKLLRSEGFQRVFKMSGGMFEWENLQLPIVK